MSYLQVCQSILDMGQYVNNWATEAIVRQLMKKKRSYAVQKGFLDVKLKWPGSDSDKGGGEEEGPVGREGDGSEEEG